jgi:hypothetical protein
MDTFRTKLKNYKIKGYPLDMVLGTIANILVIPVFTTQLYKVITRGKATDYSILFILLQLLGTPEGGGAAITGIVKKNYNIFIIGMYGFIYYCIVLYYFLNPQSKEINK